MHRKGPRCAPVVLVLAKLSWWRSGRTLSCYLNQCKKIACSEVMWSIDHQHFSKKNEKTQHQIHRHTADLQIPHWSCSSTRRQPLLISVQCNSFPPVKPSESQSWRSDGLSRHVNKAVLVTQCMDLAPKNAPPEKRFSPISRPFGRTYLFDGEAGAHTCLDMCCSSLDLG